jgi:hypothetical protein
MRGSFVSLVLTAFAASLAVACGSDNTGDFHACNPAVALCPAGPGPSVGKPTTVASGTVDAPSTSSTSDMPAGHAIAVESAPKDLGISGGSAGSKHHDGDEDDQNDDSQGNNGVGNGLDPEPPGHPPVNDGPDSSKGHPGNQDGNH